MPAPESSMRRDLVTAYLAAGSRVASWAIITGLVYSQDRGSYGLLALIRSTVGLLGYTALGIAPALVIALSRPKKPIEPIPVETIETGPVLAYETPPLVQPVTEKAEILSNGLFAAYGCALVGLILSFVYGSYFSSIHDLPTRNYQVVASIAAVLFGVGVVARLASDAYAAVLQTSRRIWLDNILLVAAEIAWVFFYLMLWSGSPNQPLRNAALAFAGSGFVLLSTRVFSASRHQGLVLPQLSRIRWSYVGSLLGFGGLLTVAQMADFLYAPTDYILINHLLGAYTVATYAPAVQIDAALMLIVGAVATTLLPHVSQAIAAGDVRLVRKYYIRGTLLTTVALLLAVAVTWGISGPMLRLWLGGKHWAIPETQAILPLVLVHTVIGGSSAVGRSVLLGMGKIKPFTIAVLIAGVANVILSYCFVKYLNLGLKGIIFGTIVAVVARCAIWQPWYVMRCLSQKDTAVADVTVPVV